jgi:hypothetical protein
MTSGPEEEAGKAASRRRRAIVNETVRGVGCRLPALSLVLEGGCRSVVTVLPGCWSCVICAVVLARRSMSTSGSLLPPRDLPEVGVCVCVFG